MTNWTETLSNIGETFIKSTNLKDVWREDNPTLKEYTFHRVGEKSETHSRLDYILMSVKLNSDRIKEETKIKKANYLSSGDQSAVCTGLELQADMIITNKSAPTKKNVQKINIKKLQEEVLQQELKVNVKKEYDKHNFTTMSSEEIIETLAKVLSEEAIKLVGFVPDCQFIEEKTEDRLIQLQKNLNRINRGLNSLGAAKRNNAITSAIQKIELNLPEYRGKPPKNNNWDKWRKNTVRVRNKLQKELTQSSIEFRSKKIKKAIQLLQEQHIKTPKKFFSKAKEKPRHIEIESYGQGW